MKSDEMIHIALFNLWRAKLRTALTILGVIIGIGALVSIVSFGTGMQKNVTEVFFENDLFTSLYVTPQKFNLDDILSGDTSEIMGELVEPPPLLGDSALATIYKLPGVAIAFPEIRIPVKIRLGNQSTKATLLGLPHEMVRFKPFNKLPYGQFFTEDSEKTAIISEKILKKLKITLKDKKKFKISLEDSIRGIRSIFPDSLLGRQCEIITSTIDTDGILNRPFSPFAASTASFKNDTTLLTIRGIKKSEGFEESKYNVGIIVPQKIAQKLPNLGFQTVWDLLDQNHRQKGYGSLYVRVRRMSDLEPVKLAIETMGFNTFSIADQLEEIKKGFLILNTILGAVGTVALVVAALGIINTMVMSILERTREIGIMKAIGGSEREIQGIFFIEAGFIGLFGGLFGIVLGWLVSRLANVVANYYIIKEGGIQVDMFYIPLWLIFGAISFSIFVSLAAGLYPARRAARVDPVEALRHD